MARLGVSVSSLFLLLCLTSFISAQQAVTQSPATDSPATSIASQSLKAMGASDGESIPIRLLGKVHFPDGKEDQDIEILASSPRTFRSTIGHDDDAYAYVINNNEGYALYQGKQRILSPDRTFGERCEYIPFYSVLGELASPDMVLDTFQSATISGEAVYSLTAHYADSETRTGKGTTSQLLIDAESFLPSRLTLRMQSDVNTALTLQVEYAYSNYQREGPFLLPHSIQVTTDGTIQSVVTITSVELNAAFSPSELMVRQ